MCIAKSQPQKVPTLKKTTTGLCPSRCSYSMMLSLPRCNRYTSGTPRSGGRSCRCPTPPNWWSSCTSDSCRRVSPGFRRSCPRRYRNAHLSDGAPAIASTYRTGGGGGLKQKFKPFRSVKGGGGQTYQWPENVSLPRGCRLKKLKFVYIYFLMFKKCCEVV